jgi:VCBS repeat-containing protein
VAFNVAVNDTDAEGQLNVDSIVIVQPPLNGTAVANADGTVSYTHNGSETTADAFTYAIADSAGNVSAAATATVVITPVNDPPVAIVDEVTISEDLALLVSGNIFANDNAGGDGGPLTVSSVANVAGNVGVDVPGAYGTFHVNADGSFTYDLDETHPALADLDAGMEALIDELAYDVSDGAAQAAASIRIRIEGVTD